MITFIEGEIVEKSTSHAVISCNGLGYYLKITLNTYSDIQDKKSCRLLTHYAVSVDVRTGSSNHMLFGFSNKEERNLFRTLIKVSGVSSNIANTILSTLDAEALHTAVATSDVKAIKSVKGVGPKLAERIINELHGKLDLSNSNNNNMPAGNTIKNEAFSALCSLGFDKSRVDKVLHEVIKKTSAANSVEELIKESLKVL